MTDVAERAMADLQGRMSDESSLIRAVMDRAKAGEITEADAMQEMSQIVSNDPELARKLIEHSNEALAPLREGLDLSSLQDFPAGGPLFYSGVGLPQVNPLVQAALLERLQFDGDVPEMRHGPLNPEALPAISVQTEARSAVAVGSAMRKEAFALGAEIHTHDRKLLDGAEQERALMHPDAPLHPALTGGSAEMDHPAYRRGEVPEPLEVTVASGGELLQMDTSEEQEAVWLTIATTQGRLAGVFSIRPVVLKNLKDAGLRVRLGKGASKVLASYQWTMNLDGVSEMQSKFNPIEVAIRVLTKVMLIHLRGCEDDLILEVTSVDNISDRDVGWKAQVCRSGVVRQA